MNPGVGPFPNVNTGVDVVPPPTLLEPVALFDAPFDAMFVAPLLVVPAGGIVVPPGEVAAGVSPAVNN